MILIRPCLQRNTMMGTMAISNVRMTMRPHNLMPRNAVKSTRSKSSKKVSESPSFAKSPLDWYSNKLDTDPIITKCVSAGVISLAGNYLAQRLTHLNQPVGTEFEIDWQQMGRFAVLNIVFVAPVLHVWYSRLDAAIPGRNIIPVAKRVFVDEFIFTPVYVPVLIGLLWGMEGTEPRRIPKMIGEEWLTIMIFDWSIYIPFQFLNFRYIPLKYQVLAINFMGVGWNCFVSWRAQTQSKTDSIKASTEKSVKKDE